MAGIRGFDTRFRTALDAAETVFARRGYGRASMRDIASAAGMSIAGLYYYLPSKQRALQLVCERAFASLLESLERAVTAAVAPDAQLRAFVRGHLLFVVEHPEAFRTLLHDLDALEGPARDVVLEQRRRYFARATDLVIAVQQAEPSAISTRVATAALFGMMNWTPMWHRAEGDGDVAGLADEMYELFLRGVAPSLCAREVVA